MKQNAVKTVGTAIGALLCADGRNLFKICNLNLRRRFRAGCENRKRHRNRKRRAV